MGLGGGLGEGLGEGAGWGKNKNNNNITITTQQQQQQQPGYNPSWPDQQQQQPGYNPAWPDQPHQQQPPTYGLTQQQPYGQVRYAQWPGDARQQGQAQFVQVLPPGGQQYGGQYPAQVHQQLHPQWVDNATPIVGVMTMAPQAAPVSSMNTTTVFVQQQVQGKKDWEKGIFGCCSHIDVCLCGFCCPLCLMCTNAMSVDANMCVCCVLCWFCPCCLPSFVRGEARKKYHIKGGGCDDFICGCCCTQCVLCQVANEIKEH